MKYSAIQSLLDTYLATVPNLPDLQLENTRNVGKSGQAFARATLLTTESVRQSNVQTRYGGLYLIDLYYPLDSGAALVGAMADSVIAHFEAAPLHRLDDDSVLVQLERSWRESVGRREPFYALQVKVRWHALI
jgi:hypothetical protein